MQRLFSQNQQRAGHDEIVAIDKADEPEHRDNHQVVRAERDAVELAAENAAGQAYRPFSSARRRHRNLPG